MSEGKSVEEAAISILTRAVAFDKSKRFTEALVCYQEGLQLLMDNLRGLIPGRKRDALKQKIEEYMKRAEQIKTVVQERKEQGTYHEEIIISDNSSGYSYESVMGRFMDCEIEKIQVTDPYIRTHSQFYNFLHFCELAVKKCTHLKVLKLLTSYDGNVPEEQLLWFKSLAQDLLNYEIDFQYEYSKTLHDREILFSNGWIIKIGRGLDYFKNPTPKFGLGKFDLHFRKCRETKIDIYHQNTTKLMTL